MKRGLLFVLSGPAGAGKGTLRKRLFDEVDDLAYSVSFTTRKMRRDEAGGREYHYISRDEFERMADSDEFLEWAEVHRDYYGTRKSDVERILNEGRDIVLEIDVKGCRQIKDIMPDAISIFITAPSLGELKNRLKARGTETSEQMGVRLQNAAMEMEQAAEYDHVIVNDDVDRASRELVEIINSYRKAGRQCE
ncbi:MAG: guanylate kinase [Synergistaceae bacterium]|jgi:guanylate kinase|nr:guanylate kinase [Synergistaceae bacterium]